MSDESLAAIMGFVAGVVLTAMVCCTVVSSVNKSHDAEAIKRGYKVYDTKTGELKWKDSDDAK